MVTDHARPLNVLLLQCRTKRIPFLMRIAAIITTPNHNMDGSGVIVGDGTYGGGTIVCPGGV
jgi:hypothetical protein